MPKALNQLRGGGILFTAVGFITLLFIASTDKENNETASKSSHQKNYQIYALDIPDKLDFAGEQVPLEMIDIKERFDRELLVNTYWQSQTLLFIKRAHKYFPIIEPILQKNGLPMDFKYLALTESGLQNLISPAGATGYWQFLKETAKEYGLEVNDQVDERYHLEKSTQAFCDYILDAEKKFGSWTKAAASYNMGMAGLSKQMQKQKVEFYYDLKLNEETERYVFRILALKEILSNPHRYGFNFRPEDLYPPDRYKTIEVDYSVDNWVEFSQKQGINYKILKVHNPWLRKNELVNSQGKIYAIKIPITGYFSLTQPSDTLK